MARLLFSLPHKLPPPFPPGSWEVSLPGRGASVYWEGIHFPSSAPLPSLAAVRPLSTLREGGLYGRLGPFSPSLHVLG